MSKRGLGKGLGALLPSTDDTPREAAQEIEIARIHPNAEQPRQLFDPEKLEELAASIREHGIVQPLLVRPTASGYEIVAGERRWRAAKLAGLKKVPAVVRELSGSQVMEIALIENLQREDLNPMEEARAYKRLLDEFGMSQEQLAKRLGKSRSQVANTLRMLQLEPEVQTLVEQGDLTMGHAKAVLALDDPKQQVEFAQRVVEQKLSVRETEDAIRQALQPVASSTATDPAQVSESSAGTGGTSTASDKRAVAPGPGRGAAKDASLLAVEAELRARFGTPVTIQPGTAKGSIELTYFGEDDLIRLVDMLLGRDVPRGTSEEAG